MKKASVQRGLTRIVLLPALLLACLPACKKSSGPPAAVGASYSAGYFYYNCTDGDHASLVQSNNGKLQLTVTGDNPVQFSQSTLYTNTNYTNAPITVQNGTGISGLNFLSGNCVFFQVPLSGTYKITARFVEVPNAQCPAPGANTCYRWFKQQAMPDGAVPSCGIATVFVDQVDPSGFIGPCL